MTERGVASFQLFPDSASTYAADIDAVTLGLTLFSTIIVILVVFLVLFFGFRYRRGSKASRKGGIQEGMKLELTWIAILFLISMGIFSWSGFVYVKTREAPAGATEIHVVGKQWMWKFQHADGTREINELHVPKGKPIRLIMAAQDVIHSLFIPAFRFKQDVLPGRYVYAWFEANRVGTYHLFCAEYCGDEHSGMIGKVIVMEPADFEKWISKGVTGSSGGIRQSVSLISQGRQQFDRLGCVSCHGKNSAIQAPPLEGIFGTMVSLQNGKTVLADESYLRESILNPNAKIVMGYQAIMPTFGGQISEEDLLSLIAYIKSLTKQEGQNP